MKIEMQLTLTLENGTEIKLTQEEAKKLRDQLNLLLPIGVEKLPNNGFVPFTVTGPLTFTTPCDHVYPTVWFGTTPPPCMKCGQ